MPLLVCYSGGGKMMRMACSMFRLLQKVLNLSETKLPLESDIIFSGSPYSAKIILHINIWLSADRSSVFLMIGNLL